jgi:transposase
MPPVRRYEMSDFEWSIIQPVAPNKPRGVARVDDRKVINGIFWRLRTGSPWDEFPERYGPHTTCYNRFVCWREKGVWDRIFDAVFKAYAGKTRMIDTTRVRVHQHAAIGKMGKNKTAPKPRLPPLGTELTPDAKERFLGALARRIDNENPCRRRRQWFANHAETDARPGP